MMRKSSERKRFGEGGGGIRKKGKLNSDCSKKKKKGVNTTTNPGGIGEKNRNLLKKGCGEGEASNQESKKNGRDCTHSLKPARK